MGKISRKGKILSCELKVATLKNPPIKNQMVKV